MHKHKRHKPIPRDPPSQRPLPNTQSQPVTLTHTLDCVCWVSVGCIFFVSLLWSIVYLFLQDWRVAPLDSTILSSIAIYTIYETHTFCVYLLFSLSFSSVPIPLSFRCFIHQMLRNTSQPSSFSTPPSTMPHVQYRVGTYIHTAESMKSQATHTHKHTFTHTPRPSAPVTIHLSTDPSHSVSPSLSPIKKLTLTFRWSKRRLKNRSCDCKHAKQGCNGVYGIRKVLLWMLEY